MLEQRVQERTSQLVEAEKARSEIQDSGNRAAAVVADMLTVARGGACQKDIICINKLVRNYLSSPEYRKLNTLYPNITLQTELKPELPMCKCSPVHIQKVIMNLVLNAYEAVDDTGKITISTEKQHLSQEAMSFYILLIAAQVSQRIHRNIFLNRFTQKRPWDEVVQG